MKKNALLWILVLGLVYVGCSSGKNILEKGQYYDAVLQSVKRLRKSPDNRKAKSTLHQAYPLAKDYHLDIVKRLKTSTDQYKWEKVVGQYNYLNRMYEEIQRCPSCIALARGNKSFYNERDQASREAAEVRYAMGDRSMQVETRQSAKEAYFHYKEADRYQPNFRDVRRKMEDALFYATLKVVIEPIPMHSQTLALSNEFFQNQINEYLSSYNFSEFVRYYTPSEARKVGLKQPDHVVSMQFDDFIVGQHFIKETVREYTRDSVVIGKSGKGDNPIYGTVKADLHTFRKTVESTGLLDFRIIDNRTNRLLVNDKFPGTFSWFCEWGFFNGDDRALDKKQLLLCKAREQAPPPPQQLFIEFTKPIYDQVTSRVANFYKNY